MADDDPQLAFRAGGEPAAQVVGREGGRGRVAAAQAAAIQPRSHSSVSSAHSRPAQPGPSRHGLDRSSVTAPRWANACSAVAPASGPSRRRPSDDPPLVSVEGGAEHGVERLGREEPDRARDRERQQRGAAGRGAGVGEGVHLFRGEQVQQGRRGHERRAGELRGIEVGEVALLDPGADGGAVGRGRRQAGLRAGQQLGVAVVQHPALRAGQLRREPAAQRAAAAAEITDHERPLAARAPPR